MADHKNKQNQGYISQESGRWRLEINQSGLNGKRMFLHLNDMDTISLCPKFPPCTRVGDAAQEGLTRSQR